MHTAQLKKTLLKSIARHAAVALFILPLLLIPIYYLRAAEGTQTDTNEGGLLDPEKETAASFTDELNGDADGDGLSDEDEARHGTDPLDPDTDGDGFSDGDEVRDGFSPLHGNGVTLMEADTDNDFLIDAWEVILGTDIWQPDSDGDLYLDGTEVAAGFDPLDPSPMRVKKHITIDTTTRRLTYSFGDRLLGDIIIATGKPGTPTPKGGFTVLDKIPMKDYVGPTWYYPDVAWNLHFTNWNGWRYYIHSAYWHNNWGGTVSGGCVNVQIGDMIPLYWFAQHGTEISVN